MSALLIQHAHGSGANVGSVTVAFASNVAAGDLLVIVAGSGFCGPAGGLGTPTDTQSNTWTQAVNSSNVNDNTQVVLWYALAAASGACTVTLPAGSGTGAIEVLIAEYSGVIKVGGTPLDQSHSNLSGVATGSITTTQANELIIAVACDGGAVGFAGPWGPGTGFTIEEQASIGQLCGGGTASTVYADQTVTSIGTYSCTFTGANGSDNSNAGIASFFASAPTVAPPGTIIVRIDPSTFPSLPLGAPVIAADLHGLAVVYTTLVQAGSPAVTYPIFNLAFTNDLAGFGSWLFLTLWDWSIETGPPPPDLVAATVPAGVWLAWDFIEICCGRGYLVISAKATVGSPPAPSAFQQLYVGILQWNSVAVP